MPYFKRGVRTYVQAGVFIALVVIVSSLQSQILFPNELSQPAQAITGGGCIMNANIGASGGGVSPGETPVPVPKGCPAIACWQSAGGGAPTCMPKPAAQGLAGGGGGLMDAIGKIMEKMMGGGGGSGGGSTQAPIDYEYGMKPECSDFKSSSGDQPAEAGSSVFLSWIRTGGKTENITISPAVGTGLVESPVELKVPGKSTTYTLTVANRSGSSTCTTRIFVGPKGSVVTDTEDLAFLAAAQTAKSTPQSGVVTTSDAILHNPLCARGRYEDIHTCDTPAPALPREQQRDTSQPQTPSAPGVIYGSKPSPLIAAHGVVEEGYVDAHAFDVDPTAFQTDDGSLAAEGETPVGVQGRNDLSALEAQMRALMNAKRGVSLSSTSQPVISVYGQPDVGVTGGLGILDESAAGKESLNGEQSLLGRLGRWIRDSFCFWCVRGSAQGASPLLAVVSPPAGSTNTASAPPPTRAQSEQASMNALQKQIASGEVADGLTSLCKVKNEEEMNKVCSSLQNEGGRSECQRRFREYVDPRSLMPYERGDYSQIGQNAGSVTKTKGNDLSETRGECVTLEQVKQLYTGCEVCKEKGFAVVPGTIRGGYRICHTPTGSTSAGGLLGSKLVCRDKSGAGNKNGTQPSGTQPPGTPGTQNPSGANPGAGSGLGAGAGAGQGGGSGGDLMKALGEMLGKMAGQSGGKGQQGQQQDPCTLANAQMNPACNPSIPTAPPSCGPVGTAQQSATFLDTLGSYIVGSTPPAPGGDEALALSSSVIYAGQSATISWGVYGKGKITTLVNYKTTDSDGREVMGTLGVTNGPTGSVDVSPDRSTTYTLKATNEVGSTTCRSRRIAVRPKTDADSAAESASQPLDAALDAVVGFRVMCEPQAYMLDSGEQPTVTWERCPTSATQTFGTSTEDASFTTGGDVSGSVDVSPRRDSTYVVRCRNQYDEEVARGSCRITVDTPLAQVSQQSSTPRPSVDIFVDNENDVVEYGESVRVEWRSKNVASCTIYGPGCKRFGRTSAKCFKEVGRSGYVVGNIYETSEFVAECRGADRKTLVTDEVHIDVGGSSASVAPVATSPEPTAQQIPVPAYNENATLDALLQGE